MTTTETRYTPTVGDLVTIPALDEHSTAVWELRHILPDDTFVLWSPILGAEFVDATESVLPAPKAPRFRDAGEVALVLPYSDGLSLSSYLSAEADAAADARDPARVTDYRKARQTAFTVTAEHVGQTWAVPCWADTGTPIEVAPEAVLP